MNDFNIEITSSEDISDHYNIEQIIFQEQCSNNIKNILENSIVHNNQQEMPNNTEKTIIKENVKLQQPISSKLGVSIKFTDKNLPSPMINNKKRKGCNSVFNFPINATASPKTNKLRVTPSKLKINSSKKVRAVKDSLKPCLKYNLKNNEEKFDELVTECFKKGLDFENAYDILIKENLIQEDKNALTKKFTKKKSKSENFFKSILLVLDNSNNENKQKDNENIDKSSPLINDFRETTPIQYNAESALVSLEDNIFYSKNQEYFETDNESTDISTASPLLNFNSFSKDKKNNQSSKSNSCSSNN